MAAGGLGNLTVFLGLDAAEFTAGLDKAHAQARRLGETIGTSIKTGVTAAAASFGALTAAGAGAIAFLNKQAEDIAAYQDMADKIGTTAAEVTRLQLAADLSGTSLKTLESASVRLTSALTKSDDEAKGAAAALAAIGLSAKEFKQLDPVAQFQAVAGALDKYRDGAEKSAVATALYGKAGAELLPYFKDAAEQGQQQLLLTEDQIAAADEYSKKIARQKSELAAMTRVVAAESIPAVEALTGAVTDAVKEFLGLDKGTKNLRDNTAIRDWAGSAAVLLGEVADVAVSVATRIRVLGNSLGGLGAAAAAVAKGEFDQASRIMEMMRADNLRMLGGLNGPGIADRVRQRLAAPPKAAEAGPDKPAIDVRGLAIRPKSAAAGDDPLKKQLDNELKLIQNAQKAEEELLRDRNKMLDLVNGENLISFSDYYGSRRAAAEESLRNQTALIDQEIAKLQAYQATAAKATDREAAQGKINDLLEKKVKLQRDAATEAVTLTFQETKAYRDLENSVRGVNASILELLGLSGDAARIRFDVQNQDLRKRLTAQGDTAGLDQLERLRQLTVAQADYNQRQTENSEIVARLQIQEERINTARGLGALGELAALQQLTEARKAAVAQQEAQVAALEAIARASENPRLILQAEQARAALERLRAESDLVAQKFDSIFSGSFSDAFGDFISGTKSAKEAFQSFADSVVQQISRIVAQQLATEIFGSVFGGGPGGGVGGFLASIFGGGRAVGGAVSPGRMYEVNEQGPELFERQGKTYLMTGGRGGRIVPNAGRGATVHNTFHVSGQVSLETQQQIASKAYAATMRAVARGTA
ncbi:phage tail tape measure C-terminal domain-containing protein [Paracidovorax citrulli]|uniref:phage tail tape measure C-terminal domain-containing protein n=1 Tax=Paracidovorax citrulli TaxID=80869 RepID=UPI0005FBAD7A|nr:phage tail tape measure C-terminal domain-containing protein [Paracidovorax citrulli]